MGEVKVMNLVHPAIWEVSLAQLPANRKRFLFVKDDAFKPSKEGVSPDPVPGSEGPPESTVTKVQEVKLMGKKRPSVRKDTVTEERIKKQGHCEGAEAVDQESCEAAGGVWVEEVVEESRKTTTQEPTKPETPPQEPVMSDAQGPSNPQDVAHVEKQGYCEGAEAVDQESCEAAGGVWVEDKTLPPEEPAEEEDEEIEKQGSLEESLDAVQEEIESLAAQGQMPDTVMTRLMDMKNLIDKVVSTVETVEDESEGTSSVEQEEGQVTEAQPEAVAAQNVGLTEEQVRGIIKEAVPSKRDLLVAVRKEVERGVARAVEDLRTPNSRRSVGVRMEGEEEKPAPGTLKDRHRGTLSNLFGG